MIRVYRPSLLAIVGALLLFNSRSALGDGYQAWPNPSNPQASAGAPIPLPNAAYPAGVMPPPYYTASDAAVSGPPYPTASPAYPVSAPMTMSPTVDPMPRPAEPPSAGEAISLEKLIQSTWYTRVEYYHWNEQIGSADFVNEYGTLTTVGYQRQVGIERFRAEVFGGDMIYKGYGQFGSGLEDLTSSTRYLGFRGEYEVVLAPATWKDHVAFLLGVGTRVWVRDIRDGVGSLGDPIFGYQETWATIYPFIGIESKLALTDSIELYGDARVGVTAVNYNFAEIMDVPLWPKAGAFGQSELGIRGQHLSLAAYWEIMTFTASSVVEDSFQPSSHLFTVGARAAVTF